MLQCKVCNVEVMIIAGKEHTCGCERISRIRKAVRRFRCRLQTSGQPGCNDTSVVRFRRHHHITISFVDLVMFEIIFLSRA